MSWHFSRALGIMKPLIQEASWKPSDAANAAMNYRCLLSTSAQAQSRITQLARNVSAQWQRTGMSATRTRQQPRCANGGFRTLMPSSNTAPTTDRSTIAKNSFGNTALSRRGLMSSCMGSFKVIYLIDAILLPKK